MEFKILPYSNFFESVDKHGLYFFETVTKDLIYLKAQLNDVLSLETRIETVEAEEGKPATDYQDYIANRQSEEGEKSYLWDSFCLEYTNLSNEQYKYFQLFNKDGENVTTWIFDGTVKIENASFGDTIRFEAVVKGENAEQDTVLGYMIKNEVLKAGPQEIDLTPISHDSVKSRKRLPAGLYIRCVLQHSTGSEVKVGCTVKYEY